MKKKTINAIITKKMNEWLSSIDDENVVKAIKNNVVVTGGCITSMLINEPVNDYDVYFKDKKTVKLVAEYYAKKFNEAHKGESNKLGRPLVAWVLDGEDVEKWKQGTARLSEFAFDYPDIPYNEVDTHDGTRVYSVSGMVTNTPADRIKMMINSDGVAGDSDKIADSVEYNIKDYLDAVSDCDEVALTDDDMKYTIQFISTNAITLSNKIQIVVRFYGEPDKIHENYDFVHATNYWTFSSGAVLNQRALEAILNKELFYIGSKYPVASMIRTRKFIKRGWQINAGQYLKIAFQISDLNLRDINVLEDQCVGVDSLYFLSFIEKMKEKQREDKDFELTNDYLTSVIDRIFG